ncbi:dethiobiotin synthase [Shewanella gaetbuli]
MYFVTGTDTDSGKTLVSASLLFKAAGKKCGFKPIASGCDETHEGLRNSDALVLMAQSNMGLSYEKINPITFKPAIAPHIAAQQVGVKLSAQQTLALLDIDLLQRADFALIEGAGGWRLPLGNGEYLSDTVQLLNTQLNKLQPQQELQVIIVVGMKLGCLNHALLTVEAVQADGLTIGGWVANQVDANMSEVEANLASLKALMPGKFLGYVPFLPQPSVQNAAQYLS